MLPPPICVDLDGTLIQEDLVYSSIKRFIIHYPWRIGHLLFWGLKGFAFLKCEVAQKMPVDFSRLTFNETLIEWLKAQKTPLYLATGSPEPYAQAIKDFVRSRYHLSFEEAFGATHQCRLTGDLKASFLKERFPSFVYVGNSYADLAVWKIATQIVAVNIPKPLEKWIMQQGKPYILLSIISRKTT